VTDNAQSVFELSVIETQPGIKQELKKDFGFDVDFEARQATTWRRTTARGQHLQGHRQAGLDRDRRGRPRPP